MAAWRGLWKKSITLREVIIGKQRHSPIGDVALHFNGEFTKFSNLAQGGAGSAPAKSSYSPAPASSDDATDF